ncbi:MAG: RNA polymerase factor sigma-54 [Megasphaera sp.]|jgi:RNA polymerase sigma-54 factor|nr:RNA polymerase factor sigma-54 [Megasphaera sp.]MCI1248079.1 RNA polymerase factor sigma-54 [Megasphaera sp.]
MAEIALKLEQKLKLSQMQRLTIQMMQLHGQDLRDFLQKQVTENPLLDIRYPDVRRSSDSSGEKPIENSRSRSDSLEESLMKQLRVQSIDKPVLLAAGLVIQNLDEKGFFCGDLDVLGQDYGLTVAVMEQGMRLVQTFDPPGIGARSVREALLIQTRRSSRVPAGTEEVLTEKRYDDFLHGRWQELEEKLHLATTDLRKIRDFLKTLSLQPAVQQSEDAEYIRADVEIYCDDKGTVSLRSLEELPEVFFRDDLYADYLARGDKKTKRFIAAAKRGSLNLQTALAYRRQSIFMVLHCILEQQRAYFLQNKPLQPLNQQDIAIATGLSTATVSRVCRDRYALWQQRVYPVQAFLAHAYRRDWPGQDIISDQAIMKKIIHFIQTEDDQYPLSDQEITDKLLRENIHIARRTVTKFRLKLNIPNSTMRRRLKKINDYR